MKHIAVFISFFCLFYLNLLAQPAGKRAFEINWTGIEKLSADSSYIDVLSFVGAQHPSENHLPYFTIQVPCDNSNTFSPEIANLVFENLTNEEQKIVEKNNFGTEPALQTNVFNERTKQVLEIRLLPFVLRNGQILKLKSFDLILNKKSEALRSGKASRHTYVQNSVLSQGKFVKIKIVNSGIYKLTYQDLTSMGINPANAHIFGYGGGVLSQNFMLSKPDDLPELPIYRGPDYILFYAQGINSWSYDKSNSFFAHTSNSYSNCGFYFVSSDNGIGKIIQEKIIVVPQTAVVNQVDEFVDFKVYERDLVSLLNSGKEFFGEKFSEKTSYDFSFDFPNPVAENSAKIKLNVAVSSVTSSYFTLNLNGSQSRQLDVPGMSVNHYTKGIGASQIFSSFTPPGDRLVVNLTYSKPTGGSIGYLNYLNLNVRRKLIVVGSEMQFQNVDFLNTSTYNEYKLSGANPNIQIWDITDQLNIGKIKTTLADGKLTFIDSATNLKHYLAVDPYAAFPKPELVGEVSNQNLHAIAQADMVILTHPAFVSQSETLAQAHREKDNLTVSVVTTDQVYNEFSSGTPDASAYRWFMKMLYDRAIDANATADMPKYLLLFGRGSFDNRKILSNSGDNLVLTYQAENSFVITSSYITDDYFALLDDSEGVPAIDGLPGSLDVGVGRFTASSTKQATDLVNKTIAYMNNSEKGNWKNQLCFLADDGDGATHMRDAESLANFVSVTNPNYQANKIFIDAYRQDVNASGETYPLAKSRLQNLISSGVFLLNYTGHGSPFGWTNELVVTLSDVKSLINKRLPIWVAATCDFLLFDQQAVSAGEEVVLNPNGGGIGVLSAARPVYSSQNLTLNRLFCEYMFNKTNDENLRVGDILVSAKNRIGTEINKLSYFYLGDPAVRLNYPSKYRVVTSKINDNIVSGNDTLKALSTVTISGYIADMNGDTVQNFNGSVHAIMYDKVQKVTTLNNEGEGSMVFDDRSSLLFSGNVLAVNGKFKFSAMMPKDIKYNYGAGKISYYAQDDLTGFEAQGSFDNFIVGGLNTAYVSDSEGPQVQLYLNTENFVPGNKVNETPFFVARVTDNNGINTVGSGIGHDIEITIDNDPNQTYVLNEYFQTISNSFTSGYVKYKLPEMSNGKHILVFKVWDLQNNSSTQAISFEVEKGLTPEILSVSCYPNPARAQTKFVVIHDRPETLLETKVEVFDLSGREVWSFSQASVNNLSWDLNTSKGVRIMPGIYLYRVSIKTAKSEMISKTNKIIVVEQ